MMIYNFENFVAPEEFLKRIGVLMIFVIKIGARNLQYMNIKMLFIFLGFKKRKQKKFVRLY